MKQFDLSFLSDDVRIIAGVDEAGRGPLAGPVVAAAVIFAEDVFIDGVNDSKQVKEKDREYLFEEIIKSALSYSYTVISNKTIDEINILQASLRAMKESVDKLEIRPDLVLIDGNKSFISKIPTKTIVKGDGKSFSIAAASIIAKVTRDRIMKGVSVEFPNYHWQKNKGYATREHINAIKKFGPCRLHRKTFLSRIVDNIDDLRLF